ncbi:MAG: TRAM domain-containing protein, partial [Actinomycetota bacterium]|nr:TRAM domain-containing protein [Actinomycetota bacterium]
MASGGGCVARAPDGRVVFVRHALPGELVVARVTAESASFLRADAVAVLEPSADRVDPPCPHAGPGRCGGCDWQHVALAAQRELKGGLVSGHLRHLAGVEVPVVVEPLEDDAGLGWRTRVRFAVGPNGAVGFRRHRSHDVEPVERCPVASAEVERAGVEARPWPGAREVEVFAPPAPPGGVATAV